MYFSREFNVDVTVQISSQLIKICSSYVANARTLARTHTRTHVRTGRDREVKLLLILKQYYLLHQKLKRLILIPSK